MKIRLLSHGSIFALLMAISGTAFVFPAGGQTIHIDITPAKAISFDPDLAMGTSMDILPQSQFEAVYSEPVLKESLSAGWGPITYRQNTELTIDAWHWNPKGQWSNEKEKNGYFTGSAQPTDFVRKSFGYALPHRGCTRSDADEHEFSRLTDGDATSYWKSNPYLAQAFSGESDALHPQWVVIDFATAQEIGAIQIAWANPYAAKFKVEYWTGKEDALTRQDSGTWVKFPHGEVSGDAREGSKVLRLADQPIRTRFLRIWMTESSNTCDTHGSGDKRNCAGYAISEISAGNFNSLGQFVDLVQHKNSQAQTATQVSSTDPWHTAEGILPRRIQTGFDLFFTSGLTNHLPAMIPIAMAYATPEDSAAEIAYLKKRGYPISYVEMGEEPDGQFMLPEDYGALYLQWATALHKVDAKLKLGGPIFTGMNEDLEVWPDAEGRTSWLGRFVDYLKDHDRLDDLSFVSFEHYPFAPCEIGWADLYREPQLISEILKTYRDDGVPANIPLMNTESNLSWALTDPMQDIFAGLWLADSVGAFLSSGGAAYYHSPIQPETLRAGCHGYSTYGNFVADEQLKIRQYTAQYFASRMLNLDWVQHRAGAHQLYPAVGDLQDEAGNNLITAYAAKRPDGQWSLLLINKDPANAHAVKFIFSDSGKDNSLHFVGSAKMSTFGASEYVWHSAGANSHADPDGPAKVSSVQWTAEQQVTLPKASVTVLTGKVAASH